MPGGLNQVSYASGSADNAPTGAAKIDNMFALLLGGKLVAVAPASTQIAPTNNWDPTGTGTLGSGNYSRLDLNPSAGASYLSGILATGINAEKKIRARNIHALNSVTFGHLNAGSAAANQFYCPGLADYQLLPGRIITLEYWETDSLWMVIP